MADFVPIKDKREVDSWVNLDFVVHVARDPGPDRDTFVHLTDGSTLTLSHAEGLKLARRLKRGEKRKKRKGKKKPSSTGEAPAGATPA